MKAAIIELEIALDVLTTNEPINRAEGKIEQADSEASKAAEISKAIACLKRISEASEKNHQCPLTVTSQLTFGAAIEALKSGKRVCRAGWNGKGMFLFLLPASDGIPTKVIHDPALRQVIESEIGGDTFDALGSIRMFTADKKILTGWLASQTDMLSEDWMILD